MGLSIRFYYAYEEQDLLDEKGNIIDFAWLIYSVGPLRETFSADIFRIIIHHSLNNNESYSKKEWNYP